MCKTADNKEAESVRKRIIASSGWRYVGADGVLRSELIDGNLALDKGKVGIRGRTIVIQAHPDDYESQPAGNAGERSACAVIP